MKKCITLLISILTASSMIQAIVIDKINITDGKINAYSQGVHHLIKAQDYGKAMAKEFQENPNARWRSFTIGQKIYTMSNPTAQWICNKVGTC